MTASAARRKATGAALLLALGCLRPRSAAAEEPDLWAHGAPTFRSYAREAGLPQATVNALTVDRLGRLWVGTNAGPAYHDGRGFRPFRLPGPNPAPFLWVIRAAEDGSLWFGASEGGALRLSGDDFKLFGVEDGLPAAPTYAFLEVLAGGGREMWTGTAEGLYRLDGDRFSRVDLGDGRPSSPINVLLSGSLPSGEPTTWAGGKALYHCEARRCAPLVAEGAGPAAEDQVLSLLETRDDQGRQVLWVGCQSGLFQLVAGRWERISKEGFVVPNAPITSLARTVSGSGKEAIWAGVKFRGLLRFSRGRWAMLTHERDGLPDNVINVLLSRPGTPGDRVLWAGTEIAGLVGMRHDGWLGFTESQTGHPGPTYSITELPAGPHSGEILASTTTGLLRLSGEGWAWHDRGLQGAAVVALMPAPGDGSVVWAGTQEHGLQQLSLGSEPAPLSWPDGSLGINELAPSLDGRTRWAATTRGLLRWDGATWQPDWEQMPQAQGNHVRCVLEVAGPGDKKSLWVGTTAGLRVRRGAEWSELTRKNSGLVADYVNGIKLIQGADGRRVLWIGTDSGLSRYLIDSGQWLPNLDTTSVPALPDNEIYRVESDAKGRAYLFTNDGITRLTARAPTPDDPADLAMYTFTTEDGLPSDECDQNGSFVDSRGRIWAGTIHGPAVFDPAEEVPDDAPKPLIFLSSRSPSGALSAGASLRWDDNTVAFEYALLSHFRGNDTRYRVQLLGFDAAPGEWSTDTKARYTNLTGGDYELRVWGRDASGNTAGPLTLAFRVRTAPWRAWWAFVAYAAALSGLVYSAARARLRALDRQNRELEARIEDRTRELRERNRQLDEAHAETAQKNVDLDRKVSELARMNRELLESNQRADRIFSALAVALPGTVLDDKYRLDNQIGSGGFGAVFRARHIQLDREVAVKVFRPSPGNDSAVGLERFRKEGMNACRVVHPNAVQVFDSGISAQGIAYVVMELLSGATLAEEIERSGALSLRRAAHIVKGMCDALIAAHATGILHRDIKPENIFLHRSAEGESVKVLDFGIAKLLGAEDGSEADRTATGLIGTPLYMAPERLRIGDYDARSDVYSVGVTCYQILSGMNPYHPGTLSSVLAEKLAGAPIPLSQTAPWVPPEAEAVVMLCLATEPADRPSLEELSRALIRSISQLPDEEQDRPRGKAAGAARTDAATLDAAAVDPEGQTVNVRVTDRAGPNERGSPL